MILECLIGMVNDKGVTVLTKGKRYDILQIQCEEWYTLINDEGERGLYLGFRFTTITQQLRGDKLERLLL
jgi:hypothetical protein